MTLSNIYSHLSFIQSPSCSFVIGSLRAFQKWCVGCSTSGTCSFLCAVPRWMQCTCSPCAKVERGGLKKADSNYLFIYLPCTASCMSPVLWASNSAWRTPGNSAFGLNAYLCLRISWTHTLFTLLKLVSSSSLVQAKSFRRKVAAWWQKS